MGLDIMYVHSLTLKIFHCFDKYFCPEQFSVLVCELQNSNDCVATCTAQQTLLFCLTADGRQYGYCVALVTKLFSSVCNKCSLLLMLAYFTRNLTCILFCLAL